MGSYLSQPVTTKDTIAGSSDQIGYACTAMQGWRTDMEDAHVTVLDVGGALEGCALFSVCMCNRFIQFRLI
jgi:protein phosphatase 1G